MFILIEFRALISYQDHHMLDPSQACNLTDVRALNKPVGVRELFDFTPWCPLTRGPIPETHRNRIAQCASQCDTTVRVVLVRGAWGGGFLGSCI